MTAKDYLKDLVSINTIADKCNKEIMDYLERFFVGLGFNIKRLHNDENEKDVLIASYGKDPGIGFLGHTDTVDIADGWLTDPFTLTETDGNLYGLGASDMKGGIACFMQAIAETDLSALKKGIKVYCTYDEELMFDGIKDLVDSDEDFPSHVIIAEPTELKPMIGSKGILELELEFKGIRTHSSVPIEGKNSNKNAVKFLNKMIDFSEELQKKHHKFFAVPYTTMNIGLINGGDSFNSVPDYTKAYVDFRICDSESETQLIKDTVNNALEGLDGSCKVINDVDSFINKGPLVKIYEEYTGNKGECFYGITEASFMNGDRIIIGPGPMTCHEKNEHVSVEYLEKTAELYKQMIHKLCI